MNAIIRVAVQGIVAGPRMHDGKLEEFKRLAVACMCFLSV